jgi:hypothetical protein
MKFGAKVQKIFWTQPFSLGWILYHFISFMNEIIRSAQMLQLPSLEYKGVILKSSNTTQNGRGPLTSKY